MSQHTPSSFAVAAIQMVSSADLMDNLQQAHYWIKQAAQAGAKIVALPEYFCFLGLRDQDKNAYAEDFGAGPIQQFLAQAAKQHGIYLIGGTLPLRSEEAGRFYNSCLVYDPAGQCIGRYDKIHLFSFRRGEESYDEAKAIVPGEIAPTVIPTPYGNIGLGICYDLRFPELFRAMGAIDMLVLPSAFTYTTGQAHWDILLRARAIENQCYVLAPAQGGRHQNGRRTWGHTMLIDPWGEKLGVWETEAGFICHSINRERIQEIRQNLPALQHRQVALLKEKDIT